jgi:hypothetical protein
MTKGHKKTGHKPDFLLTFKILLESKVAFFKAMTDQGGSICQSYFQAEY